MSYILEALKKAQAERQLGNAPTIHAPPPVYAPAGGAQGGSRRYLMLGLGLGAGALVAAAALFWSRQGGAPPVRVVAAPAPAAVPAPAVVPAPAPVVAAPVAPLPEPVKKAAPPKPKPRAEKPAPKPTPVAAAAPAEEALRSLQQLPESLRREIPPVTFGGYIYSPTPGESLLLVDKALRREGEEVAPGLVLERLTPKAAVMNYRGTRYRVAY